MLLAAAFAGPSPDLLARAIAHFHAVDTYRVTLHAIHADGEEQIRYYYKKPGFVRMEFIRPHPGALLVYSPVTRRVRLWPFGEGHFPELGLSPRNPLVRSPRGQNVDRSDVGALFENVRSLLQHGRAEVTGEDSVAGRATRHLVVVGAPGFTIAGVHRYELWLDTPTQFPLKVISRDRDDAVIETVTLDALEVDVPLADTLFNP